MAHILVVFGTTDGQTARIARHVVGVLRAQRHRVTLVDARELGGQVSFGGIDGAIVAASVRMGKFQRKVVEFARAHRARLNMLPNAFLAVSLSASHDTASARREVAKTLARFVAESGWSPALAVPVAGALQYSKYPFFTKLVIRLISKMAGGDTDPSRDYEYTDWNALEEFARRFGALWHRASVAGAALLA